MPLKMRFEPTRNCQQVARAHRAAFIVDGNAYYRALRETLIQARRSIFIVGWDLHSDLRLVRGDTGPDPRPDRLGALLDHLVAEREDLHVYLLNWDFAMIYALEREFFPRYRFKWRTHRRIHFCLDGQHPVGASQHQKIVVVDDAVAFAGGLDLSKWRWDTPAHRSHDSRRVDPDGKPYPPFHDIQMAVDGPAARALGKIARQRWIDAGCRQPVPVAPEQDPSPWPAGVTPDVADVRVAIARTLPAFEARAAVREVEQLYLDNIAAARRFIYIENQYLSSHRIGRALESRLGETAGPEVVVVMPLETGGWLEQHTMDVLRARILERLRRADRHDRFRIYYPRIAEDPETTVMVHAKVMVVDGDLVRIGSSNLSNRSMGFDSECDLAIAADGVAAVADAITGFRNRLLAEHLDAAPEDVAAAIDTRGSLIKAIEAMRQGARTLVPLSGEVPPEVDQWIPDSKVLDPEKPVSPRELFDYVVAPEQQPSAYRHLFRIILLVAGVLVLAAVWRWTPAGEWLDMESAQVAGRWLRDQPLTPMLVPAAFVAGGLVAFPVTLMILATVAVFGPWWGMFYVLAGTQLSALALFVIGRLLGRDAVRRFAGSLANRVNRKLSSAGLAAVITFRIVPVAPFSVVNLIAGASEIRLQDYILGTLVGMLPGLLAMVILADRLSALLSRPTRVQLVILGAVIGVVIVGMFGLRRWLRRRQSRESSEAAAG